MNKITFPLKKNMQGATVANLQSALQVLFNKNVLLAKNRVIKEELSTCQL